MTTNTVKHTTADTREWQDISTAPKDGSKFLVWTHRCGFVVVYHDVDDPMPADIVPSGHHLMVDDGKNEHELRGDYPTRWLPLPPAPQEKGR